MGPGTSKARFDPGVHREAHIELALYFPRALGQTPSPSFTAQKGVQRSISAFQDVCSWYGTLLTLMTLVDPPKLVPNCRSSLNLGCSYKYRRLRAHLLYPSLPEVLSYRFLLFFVAPS